MSARSFVVSAFVSLSVAAHSLAQQPVQCMLGEQVLKPSAATPGSRFGSSAALSGDVAVVGAPFEGTFAPLSGNAYVYRRSGSQWTEEARLSAPTPDQLDFFGLAVAVDGDTIAVGASGDDTSGPGSGAIFVYVHDGSGWTLQETLLSPGPVGGGLGETVALDGDTLVGGAPFDNSIAMFGGAAYVWVRSGGTWSLQDVLLAPDTGLADLFGRDVDVHGDLIAVGVHQDDDKGANSGSVWIYERLGVQWKRRQKLSGKSAGDQFGRSVTVDGTTVAVGSPGRGGERGLVDVFERTGSTWSLSDSIEPTDPEPRKLFGETLDMCNDRLVVGGRRDTLVAKGAGAAYIFDLTAPGSSTWVQIFKLTLADGMKGDIFGRSVGTDGDSFIVGADGTAPAGRAHVLRALPGIAEYCDIQPPAVCPPTLTTTGGPSAAASSGFVVTASGVRNQRPGFLLYSLTGRANVPFSGGFLCVANPVKRSESIQSGGSAKPFQDCTGAFRIDLNAFAWGAAGGSPDPALRVPGTRVACQVWGRWPVQPFGGNLTTAIEYSVCP